MDAPASPPPVQDTARAPGAGARGKAATPSWRLVTNHGVVLLALAADPSLRIRDMAAIAGITGRGCQRILNELCDAGYVSRKRVGRRNVYTVQRSMPLRHPALRGMRVDRLLDLVAPQPSAGSTPYVTAPP